MESLIDYLLPWHFLESNVWILRGILTTNIPLDLAGLLIIIGRCMSPRTMSKLKALYEFYQFSYTDWAKDENTDWDRNEEGDGDGEEDIKGDECLDPPYCPSSLEEAIARFPVQAVRKLFAHLGLGYSKIEEQARKHEAIDQDSGKAVEKRAPRRAVPVGAPKSKVRRHDLSSGSTAEFPTRSSTQSHDP